MQVPVVDIDIVFHLGTLQAAHRGRRHSQSMEGAGLSVSLCPEAWQSIEKLGGAPLHSLQRDGGVWLEVTSLDAETREAIMAWAEQEGLAERRTVWMTRTYDDAEDKWYGTPHKDKAEALYELDIDEDEPDLEAALRERMEERGFPPNEPLLFSEESWCLTGKGVSRAMGAKSPALSMDLAAMFWAEDVLRSVHPDVVGVWWSDPYEPGRGEGQAPRAAILPGALHEFQKRQITWDHVRDDEVMLEEVAEARVIEIDTPSPAPRP